MQHIGTSTVLVLLGVLVAPFALAGQASYEERLEVAINDSEEDSPRLLEALVGDIRAELGEHEDPELYALLGRTYFYLEEDFEAATALGRAIELDPRSATAHRYLGLLYLYGGRLAEAEQSLRVAHELRPDEVPILVELGDVSSQGERIDEAVDFYEQALVIEPGSIEVLSRLAPLLADSGDLERAVDYYRVLAEHDPEDPDLLYNLGQTYQLLERHESSIDAFERALHLTPDDWRAKAKVVQESQALGRTERRDAVRDSLFEQRAEFPESELGKMDFYCREQFRVGESRVFVFEYFELLGEHPRVYEFRVLDPTSNEETLVVSLGSYDVTTSIFRETGKIAADERAYHLDSYSPDRLQHATFGFFLTRPTYEATREMVLEVLAGEREAISGTTLRRQSE